MSKAANRELDDDLRPEYDFSQIEGVTRGKHAERYRQGTNLVLLEPEVAHAFPDDESVNAALRLLIKIATASTSRSQRRH